MKPRSCISKCLTIPFPWHCPLDSSIFSNRGSVCEHSDGNQSQSIHRPPVVSWSRWGRWWWWCLTSCPFVVVDQLLSCVWLCDPMDCSMPGSPVFHHLPEFAQTHVHWVGDAIQPSHTLLPPSPPAFNLSQHQRLFQWVGSLHQEAKVLELQLQHQSFQWIFRVDFLPI